MTTTVSVLTRPRGMSRSAASLSTRSPQSPPALLKLSGVALAGAFLTMVYLHSVSLAELSPVSTTVSDLIFVDGIGWLFGVSAALLAVASLALTVALARTRLPGRVLITTILSLWSLGLLVAAAFPTDPIGVDTLSLAGQIHRYAGATMYVSLPVAGWMVYRRSRSVSSWDPYRGALRTLSLAAAAIGVLFLLSSAPSLFPGTPLAELLEGHLVHGLFERALILSLFGLLMVIAMGLTGSGRTHANNKGVPA